LFGLCGTPGTWLCELIGTLIFVYGLRRDPVA
jgi:hypothetical protein